MMSTNKNICALGSLFQVHVAADILFTSHILKLLLGVTVPSKTIIFSAQCPLTSCVGDVLGYILIRCPNIVNWLFTVRMG